MWVKHFLPHQKHILHLKVLQRDTQIKSARAGNNADNGAQRRATGYAQNIGIGQGIAQEGLKDYAAQSKRRAHNARENYPRQAHGK